MPLAPAPAGITGAALPDHHAPQPPVGPIAGAASPGTRRSPGIAAHAVGERAASEARGRAHRPQRRLIGPSVRQVSDGAPDAAPPA